MKIVEIFLSIEGEGLRTGRLVTFVRLAGCNLRCSYCDTTYSYEGGTEMPVKEVLRAIEGLGCKLVTITGGEPLIHDDVTPLMSWLLKRGYEVNVETNGSIDIKVFDRKLHHNLMFTVDWKSPLSGMNDKMLAENITHARRRDVIKFVVGSIEDLDEMVRVLNKYKPVAKVYVSPVFGQIEPAQIVEYMKENKLYDISLQLQMHKVVWKPEMRGV